MFYCVKYLANGGFRLAAGAASSVPGKRQSPPRIFYEPKPTRHVVTYSLEAICAEKIRTLLQRTEPRDLYDVWRILSECADEMDTRNLFFTFRAKCEHRAVTIVNSNAIMSPNRMGKDRAAWERRLGEQVPDLPPLDRVVRETRRWLKDVLD